jgi:hypothetical protein
MNARDTYLMNVNIINRISPVKTKQEKGENSRQQLHRKVFSFD